MSRGLESRGDGRISACYWANASEDDLAAARRRSQPRPPHHRRGAGPLARPGAFQRLGCGEPIALGRRLGPFCVSQFFA